jgi:hypothetical protein
MAVIQFEQLFLLLLKQQVMLAIQLKNHTWYTSKIGLNLHRTYITTNESGLKFGNIYTV